jgi:hypothetical protein
VSRALARELDVRRCACWRRKLLRHNVYGAKLHVWNSTVPFQESRSSATLTDFLTPLRFTFVASEREFE